MSAFSRCFHHSDLQRGGPAPPAATLEPGTTELYLSVPLQHTQSVYKLYYTIYLYNSYELYNINCIKLVVNLF